MKVVRNFLMLALVSALGLSSAEATTVVIQDNYIGGDAFIAADIGKDVIGAPGRYSVDRMEVTTNASGFTVSIFSNFYDNVGYLGIQLGDLFVSTNGWNPFGPAPYINDNKNNGEQWEYALVLDNHGESAPVTGQNMLGASGSLNVYNVINSNIISSYLNGGTGYRVDQETQYNPNAGKLPQNSLALGSWSIIDAPGEMDELRLSLSLSALTNGGLLSFLNNQLGLHWTMTCGNDIIEGQTPEPSTLFLLGAAVLGGISKRRKAA